MATVELKELRKVYPGGVEAVKGVSLDIPDGDLCVLVGPSGCGKSTLLRMIAGLEKVTEGEVLIDGQRVNDREPGERDIAMVFQNYALYPHMKVYDNMAYGLRNRKYSTQEIEERVREAARILELEDLLDRRPRELSGGQRQRVAMGRAIVRHPKAFLFDEPLSNLDAKLRAQMRLEIKKLQSSLKVTSVYVTHDQVEAMTLADILVVLNGGRAEQVGSPMDIYNRPATAFVAGFIGSPSMNFLACSVSPANKGLALASGAVMKPRGMTLPKEAGQRFILGVRPEHLTQVADRNADFEITVSAIETLGADTLTHGHLDGGDGEMVARLPGNVDIREGDRLPLAIQPGFSHIFDGSSGERVPWA